MSNLSLLSIMRDDPDFGKRLQKKVQEIKVDKEHLMSAADEYGQKYQQEILEGTEKRANLLTEGKSHGLSEAEVMSSYGRFMPTVYTPILNLLYFMLRETDDGQHYQKRDQINEILIKTNQLDHGDVNVDIEVESLFDEFQKSLFNQTKPEEVRQKVNEQFNEEKKYIPKEEETSLKDTPDMVNYLYGKITLDTFNKIKKLKALSKSPNEQEAFLAYRKALELCKENNLDFDRIPCYVKGQENEA